MTIAMAAVAAVQMGPGKHCNWDRAIMVVLAGGGRYVASLKGHHDVVLCLLSAQRGRVARSPSDAEAEAAPTVRAHDGAKASHA